MKNLSNNIDEDNSLLIQIGKKIQSARKSQRKKIESVSRKIKIRGSYLIAIENGNRSLLPEHVYLKGFIKTYAQHFELDLSSDLNKLDDLSSNQFNSNFVSDSNLNYSEKLPNKNIFLIIFVIMVMIFFIWKEFNKTENIMDDYISKKLNNEKIILYEKENDFVEGEINDLDMNQNLIQNKIKFNKESKNNTNFSKIEEKSQLQNDRLLTFEITQETWIEIKSLNGLIIRSGLFNNGDNFSLKLDSQNLDYLIDTGNAGGFRVVLENKILSAFGSMGTVRKNISILDHLKHEIE